LPKIALAEEAYKTTATGSSHQANIFSTGHRGLQNCHRVHGARFEGTAKHVSADFGNCTQFLAQGKLAGKADLHSNPLGRVERGEKIISIEALLGIAKAVKLSIGEFFRGV
jgi:hypothetical protein